jgi:hypothetical protein
VKSGDAAAAAAEGKKMNGKKGKAEKDVATTGAEVQTTTSEVRDRRYMGPRVEEVEEDE